MGGWRTSRWLILQRLQYRMIASLWAAACKCRKVSELTLASALWCAMLYSVYAAFLRQSFAAACHSELCAPSHLTNVEPGERGMEATLSALHLMNSLAG